MKTKSSSSGPVGGLKIVEIESSEGPVAARAAGERLIMAAEIHAPEGVIVSAAIKIRPESEPRWTEVPMQFLTGKRWHGEFFVIQPGNYIYVIEAWVDHFKAWQRSLQKELRGGAEFARETLLAGAQLIEGLVGEASSLEAERLLAWAQELRTGVTATGGPLAERALDETLAKLMTELAGRHPSRQSAITPEKELRVAPGPAARKTL